MHITVFMVEYIVSHRQSFQQNYTTMQRSMSDSDSDYSHPNINRSCNQKMQHDSLNSNTPPKTKLRTTRSQRELNDLQTDRALDMVEKKWDRDPTFDFKEAENELRKELDLQNLTKKGGLNFGTDLVNSEEVSLDEDYLSRHQQERSEDIRRNQGVGNRREEEVVKELRLNVAMLGRSGVGKSSFAECFDNKAYEQQNSIRERTQFTETHEIIRVRQGVRCKLKLIDIPGYVETRLDQYVAKVAVMVKDRMEKHLNCTLERKYGNKMGKVEEDQRIHCCLFFLSGPWISEADWQIMKELHNLVNIIPVVAKGDTYTACEVREFKKKTWDEVKKQAVSLFSVEQVIRQHHPQHLSRLLEGSFGRAPPFVVVCCNERHYNEKSRAYEMVRENRWGRYRLDQDAHNDFLFLQRLLMGELADKLIKSTDVLMRSYQQERIEQLTSMRRDPNVLVDNSEDGERRFMRTLNNEDKMSESSVSEVGMMKSARNIIPWLALAVTLGGIFWWSTKRK